MSELLDEMNALGERLRRASQKVRRASGATRTAALHALARGLRSNVVALLETNGIDVDAALARGLQGSVLERLRLTPERLEEMIRAVTDIAAQDDPVGEVTGLKVRPNGLRVGQMRIPLGVVGIVYEARPNVTTDAAALCLRSGNAVLLRGGSEAAATNTALVEVVRAALLEVGLPEDAVSTLPSTDRAWVLEMLKAERWLDVVIPRGGEALIRFVTEHARVPVIKHYKGVCHIFVDRAADLDMAIGVCVNAKAQRPGVCNAMETLLVHAEIAPRFLPRLALEMEAASVSLRGCVRTREILPNVDEANEEDFYAEYLDLILAVRIVDDLDAAIAHIETYGSDHTESILSQDQGAVTRFIEEVNSAVVMANASTRFADGGQLGLGAEIGISTTRLHAYGPMGAADLTTRKFIVYGSGQVRS